VRPVPRVSALISGVRASRVMSVGETPSAICRLSRTETSAAVGIVGPTLAIAEQSEVHTVLRSRTSPPPNTSGSSTTIAITTRTNAFGSPTAVMPASSRYDNTFPSNAPQTNETTSSTRLRNEGRVLNR
jgi:hypothetical protein